MSERDEYFHLHEAFNLVDAIKAISGCKSIMALNALKGTIDQRIAELERAGRLVEQKGAKTERKPIKVEQKPIKPEQSKKPDGSLHPLKFLDIILGATKEPFTLKDVSDILYDQYKKIPNHEIRTGTAESYAYTCIKYMLKEGMIEEAGKKKRKGYGRCAILYKKKTKIVPEGVKDGIYENFDDNLKKLPEVLSVERDLCGTGQSNGDVDGAA